MHFVDQINFVPALGRRVANVIPQLAHIFDTVVAGAVDLDHVETVARGDLTAVIANAAGCNGRSFDTIERLRQNTRSRGFADPARPDKKIRVREPILRDRVFQRARDMRLAHQIVESLGSIFSGEDFVAHAFNLNALLHSRK